MRIRKIVPNIRQAIQKRVSLYKYKKQQQFLDTYAHIDYKSLNREIIDILEPARLGLARHAAANGMSIEISGAEKLLQDIEVDCTSLSKAEEKNKGNLLVTVTDWLFNKTKGTIVSGDPKYSGVHTVPDYFVIEYPHDGIQQVRLTNHHYDDNVLRNLYRKTDELIKALQKRK